MKKIPLYLISMFVIAGAFIKLPDFYQYDSKRIIQTGIYLIIGSLFFISLVINISRFSKLRISINDYFKETNKVQFAAWCVIFLAGTVSVLLSNYPGRALLEFTFWIIILALIYYLAPQNAREHFKLGKIIFFSAVIFVGLYVIIFIGNYITSFLDPMVILWPNKYDFSIIYEGIKIEGKEVLYFANTRFFNHTQTWTLPLLIGMLTYMQKEKWQFSLKALIFVIIACWWMLLFASGGRGTTFGVIVSLLFLLLILHKEVFVFAKNGFLTLCCGIVLYYLIFVFPVQEVGQSILRTESSRFYRWGGALEVWLQNPWFGLGPMHYAEIGPSQMVGHPHNFYLQILSEWGIIVFISFVFLLGAGLLFVYKNYYKTKSGSSNRILYVTFVWSLLAVLIHALFSGIMHTSVSQFWLILIVAWFVGFYKREKSKKYTHLTEIYSSGLYILFIIIACMIIYQDIINLNELYTSYLNQYPGQRFYPRFWGQGLFPVE